VANRGNLYPSDMIPVHLSWTLHHDGKTIECGEIVRPKGAGASRDRESSTWCATPGRDFRAVFLVSTITG
jgi:hypothetical protein